MIGREYWEEGSEFLTFGDTVGRIEVEKISGVLIEDQNIEIVERKGLGHPDFMIDSIMEELSLALCREYLKRFGRILHHNVDKGDVVGGKTEPKFGGGEVIIPSLIFFSGRAVEEVNGEDIPIKEIALRSTKDWIRENFRFLDPEEEIRYQVETKGGSGNLSDIFEREGRMPEANDTSLGMAYAPLSSTEKMVYETERYINSEDFKRRFPVSGEDVKVMACRIKDNIDVTIANSFVDRFVADEKDYFRQREEILEDIQSQIDGMNEREVKISLNALDRENRGENGVYLTVTGTSAEMGDDGQVGRGNRTNGIVPYNRPVSLEAPAGKNPVSHVGKIYNLLSNHLAEEIWEVSGAQEVYVSMLSQIGRPLNDPLLVRIALASDEKIDETQIKDITEEELEGVMEFMKRYVERGKSAII